MAITEGRIGADADRVRGALPACSGVALGLGRRPEKSPTPISPSLVYGGQLALTGVDHEDGEQLRRLGGARILAHDVMRAGPFREAFAGLEHLCSAIIHLAADRP